MTRADQLAQYRRKALAEHRQPDEMILDEFMDYVEDTGRVLGGVTPGFLRLPPRHEVRLAKEHRPAIDALPGEKG